MRVSVQSDFVACVDDLADLAWEGLRGVRWSEPGCFDVVFGEELEESVDTHCCSEDAARDICGVCWGAGFGVQPVIEVNRWVG